jgi:ABC-type multidrug transport system fused ATPase/permease subunit
LHNINIEVKKGELVAVIGGYGSGKTSLVESFLGEMDNQGNSNLTINGTIAYASQVPWIMNDTIKNNILFGRPYD